MSSTWSDQLDTRKVLNALLCVIEQRPDVTPFSPNRTTTASSIELRYVLPGCKYRHNSAMIGVSSDRKKFLVHTRTLTNAGYIGPVEFPIPCDDIPNVALLVAEKILEQLTSHS